MNKKLLPVILITSLSLQSCKLFNSLFPNTKPLELNNVVYTCKEMSEFKIYNLIIQDIDCLKLQLIINNII